MVSGTPTPGLLDAYGRPMLSTGSSTRRRDLAELISKSMRRSQGGQRDVQAKYDAALDSDDFKNLWQRTDPYDADLSQNRLVRQSLVRRSRYEIGNNGYSDGIAQTYANDLVGKGPTLRMQTGSVGFNRLVESQWELWTKAVRLRRKLWCMGHAKFGDGEGIGIVRTNPGVKHPVKLDVCLYETEQCQTPQLPIDMFSNHDDDRDLMEGYVDGIRFDKYGNPIWYDILPRHPGTQNWLGKFSGFNQTPEQVPAKYVLHWYAMRRPNQHRGVPECTSTLNTGAAFRRFREATLGAAETAADFTLLLKTLFQPDDLDSVAPMSSLDIQKRMMTALPMGWDATQMRAEHPNATYEEFHKSLVNEQARPKSMPYNKAACDSSKYNYASGRLDHQTYYGALDVEREDGNDLALDPLFALWFEEAVRVFGWLGGNPAALTPLASNHTWDWPKHQVADIQNEAAANDKNLRNGSLSLSRLYAQNGENFDDELPVLANDYFGDDEESGLTQKQRNQEMRKILRAAVFNASNQQASLEIADTQRQQAERSAAAAPRSAARQPQTAGA